MFLPLFSVYSYVIYVLFTEFFQVVFGHNNPFDFGLVDKFVLHYLLVVGPIFVFFDLFCSSSMHHWSNECVDLLKKVSLQILVALWVVFLDYLPVLLTEKVRIDLGVSSIAVVAPLVIAALEPSDN